MFHYQTFGTFRRPPGQLAARPTPGGRSWQVHDGTLILATFDGPHAEGWAKAVAALPHLLNAVVCLEAAGPPAEEDEAREHLRSAFAAATGVTPLSVSLRERAESDAAVLRAHVPRAAADVGVLDRAG